MCEGKYMLAVEENFGHVMECGCGTLHVNVGPFSVALERRSLRKLHEMLGAAIARMDSACDEINQPERSMAHASHLELRKVIKLKH